MPKTPHKRVSVFYCLLFFLMPFLGTAQETLTYTSLNTLIRTLEQDYEVKFSYVDADLANIRVPTTDATTLSEILTRIEQLTQLRIKKLNDRYYAITKSDKIAICGYVFDNFEENTVMGASVEVLDSDMAVVTDMTGRFAIDNVPRDATLRIKYIGYKTRFIKAEELLGRLECQTIVLAQFYQQLREVVVYEFLTAGLTKQSDASIELDIEKFGILPGSIEPDVLQTVQALPGIESIDETVSDINIRGGSNDQNLLLWDGIKMYQSGHFFGLISAFNPYLTEKVTLVKNGTSSQYGDGVSGLIDMRTKDQLGIPFFGGAGFNLISGDAYGQLPLSEKLAIQFSARRSLTDFFDTPTFNRFFKRIFENDRIVNNSRPEDTQRDQTFLFYDFTGKLLYDINDKQKLRFSVININNQLDYSEEDMDSGERSKSDLNQFNFSVGLRLQSKWSDRFTSSLNAYYTNYNLDSRSISSDARQQLLQNNEVDEKSVKLNTSFSLVTQLDWRNGIQVSETKVTNATNVTLPPFASVQEGTVIAQSFFSELAYTSDDNRLIAKAGVRLNNYRNPDNFTKFITEPRLNLNYTFAKNWKAIVLGEFKSQATNQVIDLEQNFLGIEKRRWVISDGTSLPVTRSKQGSLGINYDRKTLYIGLEGFYKEVKDISTLTQGFQNENQFNGEIGKYDVKGVEFLINQKTDTYSIWGSYTYNLNNYNFPDFEPSEFPNNFDIRHTATVAGTYTAGNLRLGIGLNYRSGKPFTEPDAENALNTDVFPFRINFEEPNSSKLPEYLRADASAIYDFTMSPTIDATVGLSILNFTNRKNTLNTYYQLGPDDTIERVENVSLGLTPNMSFRVRF
ncbi:TonB-dependent receptor [Aggregatimonas sangjinii]|uniref:TonB-dependent receptor n=1 Tax=Aggregatimonas sangjinii TaxID=2583587 RepID=A0A5B7SV57_9FLAO|nr:carboxypeptidase-like regulatory domain-containing protein [Aggregatimonas sangjinii]QCX01033.1 TonB-dependent receptor [Aggregatimonas sangjinii]